MTDNSERTQVGWRFWLWWVLASIVAFDVGEVVTGAVAFAVGLIVYGAITGGVMVWLLRQPVTKELSLPQDVA